MIARFAKRRLMSASLREGATTIELVVAAVLLMTLMTLVTTLCFRANLVWRDVSKQRVASGELANQLDQLTRLPKNQIQDALEEIEASDVCQRTLNSPRISATLIQDELGDRISLSLDWERRNPGLPVQLSGWLNPAVETPESQSNKESEGDQ